MLPTTQKLSNFPEISLSLTLFEVYNIFGHLTNFKMAAEIWKIKHFFIGVKTVLFTTKRVKNLPERSLYVMVLEIINTLEFHSTQDGG